MQAEQTTTVTIEAHLLQSVFLKREVQVDCYMPVGNYPVSMMSLLLINDGQNLEEMDFAAILQTLYDRHRLAPLFCIGIHCGPDRKNEYGTAGVPDFKGRGAKAGLYTRFIFEELLPHIRTTYAAPSFRDKSFAGFSLGGLSALDMVWHHPHEFSRVGVFSGSLWWRDKSQDDPDFDENADRIMHRLIRKGNYASWLRFFFEVGTMDETADRNNNGVIDAIDDTQSMIDELEIKGYRRNKDMRLVILPDGKHDVPTWARAFPEFLLWGWGINEEVME
jgi:enterochelin esterase-like enzyme